MPGCLVPGSLSMHAAGPDANRVHTCAGYASLSPAMPIANLLALPAVQAPVMTDQQVEVLRRQISVYCMLCQQLAQMHKASIQEHAPLPGVALSQQLPFMPFMPFDSGMHMGNSFPKVQARQRWTPSQSQLQILERLFRRGGRTPNKQRIKEITAELSQHGPIQETNVYNWFQNRKARAKRKTMAAGSGANDNSDAETDGECPEVKKPRLEPAVNTTTAVDNQGIGPR